MRWSFRSNSSWPSLRSKHKAQSEVNTQAGNSPLATAQDVSQQPLTRNLSQGLAVRTRLAATWTDYLRYLLITETSEVLCGKVCSSLPAGMGNDNTSLCLFPSLRDSCNWWLISAPCLWFPGTLATPMRTVKMTVCSTQLWKLTVVAKIQCIDSCLNHAQKQAVLSKT